MSNNPVAACGLASYDLSNILSHFVKDVIKPKQCKIYGTNTYEFAFRIKNNGHDSRYDSISISVVPDEQFNRNNEDIINNPYPEIALFKDGEIIYLEDIGFKFNKRYTDIREFIPEVKKLVS